MIRKVAPGYNDKQNWGDLPRLSFPPLLQNPPRASINETVPTTQLVIACVCVGDKYPAHYVTRIKSMAQRNTTYDTRFICITDRHDLNLAPAETIRPRRDLPGWYSKINLFDPHNFPAGARVLYFDLDVVITGDLDPMWRAADPFVMIREFHPRPEGAHNSSVMSWTAGNYTREIFERFEDDCTRRSWGDQECIWKIMGNERIVNWPDPWVRSFKYHGRGGVPQDCRVMVFHGDPKPDAIAAPWISELWR